MSINCFSRKFFALIIVMLMGGPLFAQEIGLQLYSLREQFKDDVEGTLAMINSWGITYLEGGETYGMELGQFQDLLKKYNLKVVSIGASYEELAENPAAVLEKAKSYGATYVMCPWIPHKGNTFTINDVKEAVEVFNAAGKFLGENDIYFTYHPHGYEFRPYAEGTLFDFMAKHATDFKFEIDVYWVSHGGEDPLALMEEYPDKFVLMHLKDMKKGTKGNNTGLENVDTNVVLGTGSIDIAAIVRKAMELEMEYLFIEDESSRVVSQVPQSLKFLRKL